MDKDKMLFSKRRRQRVLEDKRRRLKYKKRSDISTTSTTITSKSDIIINSDAFSYSQSMASLKNNCSIGSLKKNIESVNRNTEVRCTTFFQLKIFIVLFFFFAGSF